MGTTLSGAFSWAWIMLDLCFYLESRFDSTQSCTLLESCQICTSGTYSPGAHMHTQHAFYVQCVSSRALPGRPAQPSEDIQQRQPLWHGHGEHTKFNGRDRCEQGECTWIMFRSAMLGVSSMCLSLTPVLGHVLLPELSHFSMHTLSYVCPVATSTGSRMMSMLMGQQKSAGTGGLAGPAVSGSCTPLPSARLCIGDSTGDLESSA